MANYEENQALLEHLWAEFDEILLVVVSEDEEENDDDPGDVIGDYILGADDFLMPVTFDESQDVSDRQSLCDNEVQENVHEVEPTTMEDGGDSTDEENLPLADIMYMSGVVWKDEFYEQQSYNQFQEHVGPNIEASEPIEIFMALFPEDLVDLLVFQTNLYCAQNSGGENKVPTNREELKTFLGINILMGIKKLPSYRDYWSSCPQMRDHYISSAMSVNRFGWFLTNLHVNDNSQMPPRGSDGYDKLYKIRPLLQKLSETFRDSYDPTEYQAVDESMIPFKGRSSLKQYMPDKPTKRGYKVWVRADSHGYVSQFQIYEGKRNNITEKNLGKRVVTELTADLVGKNYSVYFDNYFSSTELMIYLQRKKIKATATTRSNRRDFPKKISADKNLSRGDAEWKSTRTGIVAMKWQDRKGINFLSNCHNPTKLSTVDRKTKNGTGETINCPLIVKDYNKHMGNVDKADMLKTIYCIDRKSRKWWHRIFFHMLDTVVINSFVIFSHMSEGKLMTLKQFRLAIAVALIGINQEKDRRGRKSSPSKSIQDKCFAGDSIQ